MKDFKKKDLYIETSELLNKNSVNFDDVDRMVQIQTEHLVRKGIAPYMNEFVDYTSSFATSVKNGNDRVYKDIDEIKKLYEKIRSTIGENEIKMYTAHHIDNTNEYNSNDLLSINDILKDHKPPFEPIIISMNDCNTDELKCNCGFMIMKNRNIESGYCTLKEED